MSLFLLEKQICRPQGLDLHPYHMVANNTYSMTGFGRAEKNVGEYQVLVELKSLNGKQLDCFLKIPPLLKSFEFDIRNLITGKLQRGSIDALITVKLNGAQKPSVINKELFADYYRSVAELGKTLGFDPAVAVGDLLRIPDMVTPLNEVMAEADWRGVAALITEACDDVMTHRQEEGAVLHRDIESRIASIAAMANEVELLAPARAQRLRDGIHKKLDEWIGKDQVDENRLEQEIIYYLEKIDITEELTRLKNHCDYFFATLAEADTAKGKKLGFLLQEIGREINTTGAKANDAGIQKLVIMMKDDLEKAKEQTLNLL